MKKQALAIAIASAMVAPSAFAAQDTSGMHFTSASEGFYASLRARLDFSSGDTGTKLDNNSSRFGVRGTNDLGGGLEGFYQWEGGLSIASGGFSDPAVRVRLGHVGLRGNFGELVVGSFWPNDYNWTFGSTDIANNYSGFLAYHDDREGRANASIQYTTPDLNGFQGAIRIRTRNTAESAVDNEICIVDASVPVMGRGTAPMFQLPVDGTCPTGTTGDGSAAVSDDNDLDAWNLAATYAVQGFTVGGAYNVVVDGLTSANAVTGGAAARLDDRTAWTVRLGYAQDNWYVNGWYGETNHSDGVQGAASNDKAEDLEAFSIAAGVSVDKVNLYVGYETAENSDEFGQGGAANEETTYGLVGVQYNLGSQSRVWIEYWSRDVDANSGADDVVSVGLRHDF